MRSKQNKNSPLMILCGESKNAVQAIYLALNKKTPNLLQKVSKLGVFFYCFSCTYHDKVL
nr:MAG TPA: hypothetical protein [Caudoviricetes sp.]